MATAAEWLTFLIIFLIGFICGKLFAAVQLAAMKTAAKGISPEEAAARRSVNTMMRIGRRP